MPHQPTRRQFVQTAAAASAGIGFWIGNQTITKAGNIKSPDEKMNVACFGVGGRGGADMVQVGSKENIVALCDIDERKLQQALERFPDARTYRDFRELLEAEGDKLDAVTVGTPDHMHGVIAAASIRRGLHCYCEKPLTWSIEEARMLSMLARRHGVVTQMGNQGSATHGFRTGVETLWSGAIGPVREVHIWTNRPVWPQAIDRPTEAETIPDNLHWNLWLGVAPDRPYNRIYQPFNWRGWYDFGTGALGDMGCHTINLAYRGLKLDVPLTVQAEVSDRHEETFPAQARVTFEFPARGIDYPPVTLVWYSGGWTPPFEMLDGAGVEAMPKAGCILLGDDGRMFSPDDYGSKQILYPTEKFTGWKPPARILPRVAGHHLEWMQGCHGGAKPYSNFEFASRLTETALLGALAIHTGKRIIWDRNAMRAHGVPEADDLIFRKYREGYSL